MSNDIIGSGYPLIYGRRTIAAPTAFWCANCNATCCWECGAHDESIDTVKHIGSRYCDEPACVAAARAACDCPVCRSGEGNHLRWRDDKPCPHKLDVVESARIEIAGPPMRGLCSTCGVDLGALRERGKIGHVCFGKGDSYNVDEPS